MVLNRMQHLALQERNAALLMRLLERSKLAVNGTWDYRRLKSEGYMDLSIDRLGRHDNVIHLALAHNGKQNGDLMADPDMEVAFIGTVKPRLRALHYQNDYIGVFSHTADLSHESCFGVEKQVYLDVFLAKWLKNLLEQGHVYVP